MKDIEKQLKKIFSETDRSMWETVKFGDVVREVKKSCNNPESRGIDKIVGLEHLVPLDIHIRNWKLLADGTTFTRLFRKGQVLFGRRRAYQRKAAIAEFDGLCSGDIIVMEAIENKLDPRLLPFIVHSDRFFDWAVSTSAGSLSPRTKFKHLAELEFQLPTLSVQQKISELLWTVDSLEKKYVEVASKLNILIQSMFKEKFSLKHYEEMTLETIADINPKLSKDELSYVGEVDFIPMESVSEDGEVVINQQKDFQKNRSSLTTFKSQDVLFAKITPCMENGKGALVPELKSKIGLGSTEFHILRAYNETDWKVPQN